MSLEDFKNILKLEREVSVKRRNGMSAEEARAFHDRLISCQEDFAKGHIEYLEEQPSDYLDDCDEYDDYQKQLDAAEYFERKMHRMEDQLKTFFEPVDKSTSSIESKVNNSSDQNSEINRSETRDRLDTLLQKQKFYIQMIDSLKPEGQLSSKKAELQYEHVSQFYEKFISNQSEIVTLLKDAAFDVQVNISKEIDRNVISIQETLKKWCSSIKPTASPESQVNVNRCSPVVDFLGSLRKKQKFLIEKINVIDSKNNVNAAEAEILFNHLSQLYESFVRNQATIETYVEDPRLEEELKISGEILEKVMSLQMKLKKIVAPVASSLDVSMSVDESEKNSKDDKISVLNWLIDEQQRLIKEINSIDSLKDAFVSKDGPPVLLPEHKIHAESSLKRLSELKNSFISNQRKIQDTLDDDYELDVQETILKENFLILGQIQKRLEVYLEFCTWFGI